MAPHSRHGVWSLSVYGLSVLLDKVTIRDRGSVRVVLLIEGLVVLKGTAKALFSLSAKI